MTANFPPQLTALLNARAYSHPADAVTLVETHISWVLLAGGFAYKIKRPVRFPFVDQRSLQRRHFLCQEELRLNRRFAPTLYLDVVGISLRNGEACMGGEGGAVEYAVRMRRFDRAQELDRLLEGQGVEPEELAQFGRRLAELQQSLPLAAQADPWGQPAAVRALILRNFEETLQAAQAVGSARDVEALRTGLLHKLASTAAYLQLRQQQGFVREGHGDLHARNIARVGEQLLAFDCVEFEPSFRWIDVADEVALLLADLEARRCQRHAHAFWNAYLEQSGDYAAHRVLDLYKAHRALVRAKVAAVTVEPSTSAIARASLLQEHQALLNTATHALAPRKSLLLLIGGLSGSGKTWLARRLAPSLQLIHLRSDVERKRLGGLVLAADSHSELGANLYAPAFSEAVYARLCECAEHILTGGYSALVDATLLRRETRQRFVALAARLDVRLGMIYCCAESAVLRARLAERQRAGNDASEADARVLEWQLQRLEPIEADEGIEVLQIDTDRTDPAAFAAAQIRRMFLT